MSNSSNKDLHERGSPGMPIITIVSWCPNCLKIVPKNEIKECIHEQCSTKYCKSCGYDGSFCSKKCHDGTFMQPNQH